jgi:AcrR family transcriptional regulator
MEVQNVAPSPQMNAPARGDRVARTRDAIVGSALALALAGEVAPIVRDIAKMAGVSARTVFQHFADTAELYVAVLTRVMSGMLGDTPAFDEAMGLDQRLSMLIDQHAQRGERLLPMWTFVETLQRRSTEASDMMVQMYNANRVLLSTCFERELAGLSGEARERTLNALALAMSPESWVVLRLRLGLGVDQAREQLGFVARAIFKGAPGA